MENFYENHCLRKRILIFARGDMSHDYNYCTNLQALLTVEKKSITVTKKYPCHTKESVAETCPQCEILTRWFTHLDWTE